MASSAIITVVGHITDPQSAVTPQGHNNMKFSIPVTTKQRDGENTTWYRVTVWGNQAKGLDTLSEMGHLAKGSIVQVTGPMMQREYTASDGTTRTSNDVNASNVVFIAPPKNAATDTLLNDVGF